MKNIRYFLVLILIASVLVLTQNNEVKASESPISAVADVELAEIGEYVNVNLTITTTEDIITPYLRLDLAYPTEGGHFDTNLRCDTEDVIDHISCDYTSWSYIPDDPMTFVAGIPQEFTVRVMPVQDVAPAYSEIESGDVLMAEGLNWGECTNESCTEVDNQFDSQPFGLVEYLPYEVYIVPEMQSTTEFDTYLDMQFTLKTNRDKAVEFEYVFFELAYPIEGGHYESNLRCNPNIGSYCDAISINYWEGISIPSAGLEKNHQFLIVNDIAPAYKVVNSGDQLFPEEVTWSVCLDDLCESTLRGVSENSNTFIKYFKNPDITLPDNTTIEFTDPNDSGTTVTIYKNGIPVAKVTVDRSSGSFDWSSVSVEVDRDTYKAVLSGLNSAPGTASTHSLLIPYDSERPQNDLWICPDAQTINEVSFDCSNGYSINVEDSDVELVEINGVSYWKVSGLTGTGGLVSNTNSLAATGTSLQLISLLSLITISGVGIYLNRRLKS